MKLFFTSAQGPTVKTFFITGFLMTLKRPMVFDVKIFISLKYNRVDFYILHRLEQDVLAVQKRIIVRTHSIKDTQ